jgi:hypothetical protein
MVGYPWLFCKVSPLPKIILHIGVENTGTTYLQRTFAKNRAYLRDNGILYPISPGEENHWSLAAFAVDQNRNDTVQRMAGITSREDIPNFRWNLRGALRREFEAAGCETLLLSNEHCSSRLQTPAEVARLASLLRSIADEVKILVFLRRQDEAHLSIFSTSVREGWTLPLSLPNSEDVQRRYDYKALLDRWSGVFGKDAVIVRRYSHHDSLQETLSAVNFSLPGLVRPDARLNPRLNAKKIELLRSLNALLSVTDRGDIAQIVDKIALDGPPLAMPREMAQDIMKLIKPSNTEVAKEYFSEIRDVDPLFGPADREQDDGIAPHLTAPEILAAMAKMWALKHEQSRHLWEHVQMLQRKLEMPT